MRSRVALVEDDPDLCDDLAEMIDASGEFSVVCACRSGRAALKRIPALAPDIVIMDLKLPDACGTECTAKLKRLAPSIQVVVFTFSEDDDLIFRSLEAGASGYLLKGSDPERVLEALREVRNGGAPLSSCIARKVVGSFARRGTEAPEPLTPREVEVLGGLAKGYISKEIAAQLSISLETVNYHLKHIYQKLHVRTRTEAVIKYLGQYGSP